jgi:hypothetical protein
MPKNEPLQETYRHAKLTVSFFGLPAVRLVSVLFRPEDGGTKEIPTRSPSGETYQPSWFTRVAESTVRRHFTLERDWEITISGITFNPRLNGTLTIPARVNDDNASDGRGELVVFDGASVPMPWLISFLSLGILRPLGVMLTASIVHDFAFQFGYLLITQTGEKKAKKVTITREVADRLFREIIITVNKLPIVGWVAWLAVRLGWFGLVRYKGKRFGGRAPLLELVFTALLFALPLIYIFMPENGSDTDRALQVLTVFASSYLLTYFATLIRLAMRRPIRQ